MGIDLSRELEDAAERGTAHRAAIAAGPVLQRIHRRRVVRAATNSAVGLAAVAAVALGGLQLAERRPAPPAGPTPTVTPQPTSSATPTEPAPAPSPFALPACGEGTDLMADLVMPPGAVVGDTWAQVGVVDTETGAFYPEGFGDHLRIGFTLTGSGSTAVEDVVSAGRAVVARDGVAVATYPDGTIQDATIQDGAASGERLVELVDCADGSYPGPGDYVLWLSSVVQTANGPVDVVHAPVPFTVFEFEDADNLGAVRWTPDGPVDPDSGEAVAGPQQPEVTPADESVGTLDGLAGLSLGTTLTGTSSPSPVVVWDAARCPGTDLPGRWVPSGGDVETASGMPGPLFGLSVFEERVVRIDVFGRDVRTPQGVGVGSTLDEVRAAHDVTLLVGAEELGVVEAWGVVDGERTLVFEIASDAGGGVDAWSSAQKGTVVAMAVLQGIPYATPARGTDTCG